MKIEIAINSSDSNELYLDFWPSVSRAWSKLNIKPILLYIADNYETIPISEEYGTVIRLKPICNIPIYLQTQMIRYWYATQIKNTIGIISDIDMYPLSNFYFNTQLENISNDKYVHLNPCADNIPACYHVASGDTYKKVLGDMSFDEYITKALLYSQDLNTRHADKEYWSVDEIYSTMLIKKYTDQSIFHFIPRDCGQNGHRIDRANWKYNPLLIKQGYYYDSHSIRPFKRYSNELNKIVDLL
jgi:hypothetical protein